MRRRFKCDPKWITVRYPAPDAQAEGASRPTQDEDKSPGAGVLPACSSGLAGPVALVRAGGLQLNAHAHDARFEVAISPGRRRRARLAWRLRRMSGKMLTALRVGKAAATFEGGLDYLLWKIARHSGKRVIPTPWQRRHPFFAGPLILWRLYRLDAYR